MKISQDTWTPSAGWENGGPEDLPDAQVVLLFGGTSALQSRAYEKDLEQAFPLAELFGCSTAGEICGERVSDDTVVATAIHFEKTGVVGRRVSLSEVGGSVEAGQHLGRSLDPDGLNHVLVLSEGLNVNGSELVTGLTASLPGHVRITGGLSGDGGRFEETFVLSKDGPERDVVSVLGFYGDALEIGCASLGGWDTFGPERLITRSEGNVLYELDGRSALELYKEYLGDYAADLPASGLLFPLALRTSADETPVVRTILSVDEDDQSLTFAGDVPEGSYARLMKANMDRLVDGAAGAAKCCRSALAASPDLALLISCVGRKIVLKQRVEEEVEAVRGILGDQTVITGFYSYGEISPFTPTAKCELHNQTMTITTFKEK